MPEEWKMHLQKSTLTLKEKLQNPQAVLIALEYYDYQLRNSTSKYMYSSDKSKFRLNLWNNWFFNYI